VNWYGYCDGNPVNYIDPDGCKRVILNNVQGIHAHNIICDYYEPILVLRGAVDVRCNRWIVGLNNVYISKKRPDILAKMRSGIQYIWEIKQEGSTANAVKQLNGYLNLIPNSAIGGALPSGVVPFPEIGPNGTLSFYTEGNGIIYYVADDGEDDDKTKMRVLPVAKPNSRNNQKIVKKAVQAGGVAAITYGLIKLGELIIVILTDGAAAPILAY
jgi:hypothetical protein